MGPQGTNELTFSDQLGIAEYTLLRQEIVKHFEVQTQLVLTTLGIAGTLVGAALQIPQLDKRILLLYPLLALFLALLWKRSTDVIDKMGRYTREVYEPRLRDYALWVNKPGQQIGWETRWSKQGRAPAISIFSIAVSGVFVLTPLFVMAFALLQIQSAHQNTALFALDPVQNTLLVLDAIAILASALVTIRDRSRFRTEQRRARKQGV